MWPERLPIRRAIFMKIDILREMIGPLTLEILKTVLNKMQRGILKRAKYTKR